MYQRKKRAICSLNLFKMFLKLETLRESTTILFILDVISDMAVSLCGVDLVSNISMVLPYMYNAKEARECPSLRFFFYIKKEYVCQMGYIPWRQWVYYIQPLLVTVG